MRFQPCGCLLLAALGVASAASAQVVEDKRFFVVPMASYVKADEARGTDDAAGGVLGVGVRLNPQAEILLFATQLKYDADIAPAYTFSGGGIGYNYFLSPSGSGLYVHADVAGVEETLFDLGLGYDFSFLDSGWALRLEALAHTESGFQLHETQYNLGLRIPLGAKPEPPPPEVRVVPLSACGDARDNDGDGKTDYPADPGCSSGSDGDEADVCAPPQDGQPLSFSGCKSGDALVLRGVNFDFDQATLTVEAKAILDDVARALLAHPEVGRVEIGGHTDDKGDDTYNLKLSERRAQAVTAYLTQHGVAADRLEAKGYGELVPIAANDSDEGRAHNRRVELKLLGSTAPAAAPVVITMAAPEPAAKASPQADPGTQPDAKPKPAPAPAAAPPPTANTVLISNYQFQPPVIAVARGATVTWTNQDATTHTIKFAEGEISIAAGASYSRKFDTVGDLAYSCGIHPSMKGSVAVAEY